MSASPSKIALVAVAAALVALPLVSSEFVTSFLMTRILILAIAAASIVFLFRYGGMVSLGQFLIFGVAGFMVGNAVGDSGSKGLKLGWDPWVGVIFALVICLVVALVLGALASRTSGIYFLMLTLTYAVIGYYFFGQVTTLSGFGGITGIRPPPLFEGHPWRLYYVALGLSLVVYIGFNAISRTPFGLALQGTRDDPIRMASLGFNVPLHRTLAFVIAGFVAGCAGILNIWWNGQIDPTSISIGPTLDLLIIAVIGGISYFEGAWLGAAVYVSANIYLRNVPLVDQIGITEARFNTVIGLLVLLIMVLSPEGIMGIIDRLRRGKREAEASVPAMARVGSG
ncbi:MAG: branched-chain amino acid ABC transporter permease [Acidimicrobiia bacterium]